MIKKTILLGLAAYSAYQFIGSVNRYLDHRKKSEHKQALNTWENEGGNPAPARQPYQERAMMERRA
jgi:hypothetical protein